MIQFNLLPDVKQAFIKAQRVKRLVIVVSIAVAGFTMVVTLLLFMVVNVYQKKQMDDLSKKIVRDTATLKGTEDLDKILTIQNQLNNMTALHETKPAVSRLKDYVSAVTPKDVSYAKIDMKMVDNSMEFTGAADSLKTVNQFIDTLKFTKFKVEDREESKDAFSNVVLDTFGRDDKGASFKIKLNFDPVIFDNKLKVTLNVPNTITTRSFTEKPSLNLFQPLSDPEEEKEGSR